MNRYPTSIHNICQAFFTASADQFPIVSASDEFYYFPQVRPLKRDWSHWDTFSEAGVSSFARKIAGYERALLAYGREHADTIQQDLETRIDLSLLTRTITTLREQLIEVRTWEKQPTFHLTIACLGIAEALASEDASAGPARAETLPDFIDSAITSLKNIPILFRDLGLSMLTETRRYLISLVPHIPDVKASLPRLDAFEYFLRKTETMPDFRMSESIVKKIVRNHLNCGLDVPAIQSVLDSEINDMQAVLTKHAVTSGKDSSWMSMVEKFPLPEVPAQGLVAMYREQVLRLAEHCLTSGLLSDDAFSGCPVHVRSVPDFLSAIRTASSYSIQPDYPPTGGVFYVINADDPAEARKAYQREFRILSAHETYPGHHFLDSVRLHHSRPLRRCIERPIFYEGWACFAEQLMRLTGYFDNEQDHMLLARRRLWRAIRGKVDLGLQTGSLDFENAIAYLMKTGINKEDAAAVIRKYPLNPGYQLCYTLGFKRFSTLFKKFGQNNLVGFVSQAVSQGEIDFDDLERILILKTRSG